MRLSVVVTVVDGGQTLARCLEGLAAQEGPPDMEVIVPFDDTVNCDAVAAQFPDVRFLDMGRVKTRASVASEAGRHELYDRRRAAGLRAAEGEIVAMLEDRGSPRTGWARALDRLHRDRRESAIGGAIECESPGILGRAVYLCDFGRYGLPRPEGLRDALSDTNVAYCRGALERVREQWEERFHEPRVHAALGARSLWFSPDVVVDQLRVDLSLAGLLAERFHWGRLFGAMRASRWSAGRRLAFAIAAPLLPPLLWVRLVAQRVRQGRMSSRFVLPCLAAAPLLILWSLGEAVGYATGRS